MNTKPSRRTSVIMAVLVTALTCVTLDLAIVQTVSAAEKNTAEESVKRLPTYFPNTEELGKDEMRITALGTGLPTPLTRA